MNIKLGERVHMDLDKAIESRVLVQANSGGGKSYTIRRFIEQTFGKKQIIVLDPEGEFANMRSRFDFVYAGPGGDAPVESRSAALLARRLLELKASAIIDLYELSPQERKHFVRLFLESMVNAPKELWHDCFVILDEAHIFAPEKDQSESLGAVIDLASRGRKRGYCLIPATQRPAKLNKDVAAECNNKLIGRASLDIDRKRAAEELGFTSREEILSLRDLEPGEFYAFGPAIGRDVVKTKIGEVQIPPAKRGAARGHIPAPSAKVKAILSKLSDLPQEAQKEAQTVVELKAEIATLKRHTCPTVAPAAPSKPSDADIQKALEPHLIALASEREAFSLAISQMRNWGNDFLDAFVDFESAVARIRKSQPDGKPAGRYSGKMPTIPSTPIKPVPIPGRDGSHEAPTRIPTIEVSPSGMPTGQETILNAIAQFPGGITNDHIAVLTGYKATSRRTYLQKLVSSGYITRNGENYEATSEGIEALGDRFEKLPTGRALLEHWLTKLPEGERKILQAISDAGRGLTKEEIGEATEYKPTSVRTYVQKLAARKVVSNESGIINIVPSLYE